MQFCYNLQEIQLNLCNAQKIWSLAQEKVSLVSVNPGQRRSQGTGFPLRVSALRAVGPILSFGESHSDHGSSVDHTLPASSPAERQNSTSLVIQMKTLDLASQMAVGLAWITWSLRNAVCVRSPGWCVPSQTRSLRLADGPMGVRAAAQTVRG